MYSPEEIEAVRARVSLVELISVDVALKKKGREWVGCCPVHQEKTPSFYVYADGHGHCFGCGFHCDAISYLMRSRNLTFREAMEALGSDQPLIKPAVHRPTPAQLDESDEDRIAAARRLLAAAKPIDVRSAGWLYLWSRGLATHQPGLRFHPACPNTETHGALPALIAPLKNSHGRVTAVQRIWCSEQLEAGARDSRAALERRKATLGRMEDGAVRLAPPAHGALGIAEGVETAIAASMLYRLPVWAVCGLSRLGTPATGRPPSIWIPDDVEQLTIFGDNGDVGRAVGTFAAEWYDANICPSSVVFPPDGIDDFNTMLLRDR